MKSCLDGRFCLVCYIAKRYHTWVPPPPGTLACFIILLLWPQSNAVVVKTTSQSDGVLAQHTAPAAQRSASFLAMSVPLVDIRSNSAKQLCRHTEQLRPRNALWE